MSNLEKLNDYTVLIESEEIGKFIDVFHTPTQESRTAITEMYNETESDKEDFIIKPLKEALDFIKKKMPDRKQICNRDVEDTEVIEYIKSNGFYFN